MSEMEPIHQAILWLVIALAIGPWLTISGLRVMRKPSRVAKKSLVNWTIRLGATRHPLGRGNIYFWAQMVFLSGIIWDLIGMLSIVAIVGVLLGW